MAAGATALVALAAAIAYVFAPKPVAVDVATVARGALRVTVDEEGKTRIRERYVVAAPLSGRTQRCELHAGDPVKAGDTVVARLDPTDPALLDPRELAQAQARAKAAEAANELAVPRVERAKTAWDYARSELARSQKLFQQQTVSRAELDAAEQQERLAAKDVAAAEFSARIATFELELAQAALLCATPGADPHLSSGADTPADLGIEPAEPSSGFRIRSPIDGRVLRVFQESSTVVAAGAPLLELGDPSDLEVEIEMLSTDAVKVRPGAEVLLDRWGGSSPLHARVRLIEPAAFTKVSALGVEEQRTLVLASFTDPTEQRAALGDAFRVETHVVVWEGESVLLVPVGALFRGGGEAAPWMVFVVEGGRARSREVQIGQRNDRAAEVRGGVKEGERVVVYPSDRVSEGARVVAR